MESVLHQPPSLSELGLVPLGDDDDDKKNGLYGNQWDCLH